MTMIEIKNLTFGYSKRNLAVNDITTTIGSGIHLLLGKNGAGKTTLFHIITGLQNKYEGTCQVNGVDTARRLPDTRCEMFFLPDEFDVPGDTINKFAREHSILYSRFSQAAFAENLAAFGITGDAIFTAQWFA